MVSFPVSGGARWLLSTLSVSSPRKHRVCVNKDLLVFLPPFPPVSLLFVAPSWQRANSLQEAKGEEVLAYCTHLGGASCGVPGGVTRDADRVFGAVSTAGAENANRSQRSEGRSWRCSAAAGRRGGENTGRGKYVFLCIMCREYLVALKKCQLHVSLVACILQVVTIFCFVGISMGS